MVHRRGLKAGLQNLRPFMTKQSRSMRLRSIPLLVSLAFSASVAWAVDPFNIRDIRVEGLQRVEPGTVFASLPVRVGETYDDEKGAAAIRALFALGLFKDVRLEVSGNVLVVIVEERPSVAEVDFTGTKEFDKEVLRKALRDVGLAEGRAFDKALADRAEQELKRQYVNRSLYGAEVVTTVTPIERNRVNLNFAVFEGELAKIKEIRINGNRAFGESTLKDLFDLDTGGWLSWYTKSDRYSRAKLNADLESLRSYYLTRGYLEFRIDSTQVAISPNKQDISITINVTEGERFVVSAVRLEGNYLDREDEFKSLVTIEPGKPYNVDRVAATTKAFGDYFGRFGFAFAQVEARPEIDRGNNQVVLVLQSEPSRRAYVRQINVEGNTRTRDEVIRREFRQFEASWYDAEKIALSRDRVDRLGYFTEVGIETREVAGSPDQVDVVLAVKEKPTGSIQLGAGFSSADKLSLTFGIKQENAFGSGNSLGIEVNTSDFNRQFVFSTTNPYFTPDGVSRTLDLYTRTTRPFEDEDSYSLRTNGAGVRFGVPFSEVDTVFFGIGYESTTIRQGTNLPVAYQDYIKRFGASNSALPLSIGWSRDERDSALVPTRGTLRRLSGEWSVAGDSKYLRTEAQYQTFYPLNRQFTLAFNGELGWGKGLGGRDFPLFKNFYAGGLGSVRGFDQGTLGPRDSVGDASIGGARKLVFNAELLAPFPGAGNDRTLRMFGFFDVGNVFAETQSINFGDLRSSAGVGISWLSPVGPLRIAYARPIRSSAGDKLQKLQFQIGTAF